MSEQWTDEQLREAVKAHELPSIASISIVDCLQLMRRMRDELTAQYAAERDEKRKLRQILAVKLALFDSEIDDMLAQPDAE